MLFDPTRYGPMVCGGVDAFRYLLQNNYSMYIYI